MDRPVSRPDLSIAPDAVRLIARRMNDLSHESEALVAATELFTTDQVSHPDLADALRGFVGEWNQQVRHSSGHFADVALRLDETVQSYQDLDDEIADALTPSSRRDGTS